MVLIDVTRNRFRKGGKQNEENELKQRLKQFDIWDELSDIELAELRSLIIEIEEKELDIDTSHYREIIVQHNVNAARRTVGNKSFADFNAQLANDIISKIFTDKDEYMDEEFIEKNCEKIQQLIVLGSASKPPNADPIVPSRVLQHIIDHHQKLLSGWDNDTVTKEFNAPMVDYNQEVVNCATYLVGKIRPYASEGVGSTTLSQLDLDLIEDEVLPYMYNNGIPMDSNFQSLVIGAIEVILSNMDIKDGEDIDTVTPVAEMQQERDKNLPIATAIQEVIQAKAKEVEAVNEDEKNFVDSLFSMYKADQVANHEEKLLKLEELHLPASTIPPLTDEMILSQFRMMWDVEIRNMIDARNAGYAYIPNYVNKSNGFRTEPFNPFGSPGELTSFMEKFYYKESFYFSQMTKFGVGQVVDQPKLDFFKLEASGETEENFLFTDKVIPELEGFEEIVDEKGIVILSYSFSWHPIPIYRKPIQSIQWNPCDPLTGYYEYERRARKAEREMKLKDLDFIRMGLGDSICIGGRVIDIKDMTNDQILDIMDSYENQMYSEMMYESSMNNTAEYTPYSYKDEYYRYVNDVFVYNSDGSINFDATFAKYGPVELSEKYIKRKAKREKIARAMAEMTFHEDIKEELMEDTIDEILGINATSKDRSDIRKKIESLYDIGTGKYADITTDFIGINRDKFNASLEIINGTRAGKTFEDRMNLLGDWILKGARVMDPRFSQAFRDIKGAKGKTFKELMAEHGQTAGGAVWQRNNALNGGSVKSVSDQLYDLMLERGGTY